MLAESGAYQAVYLNDLTIFYLRCRSACDSLHLRNCVLLQDFINFAFACRGGIAGARRIEECRGRRELGCTSTRWVERQRIIGAEANRIAMLTRQRRAQAVAFRRHKSHSSPRLPIKSLSLGVPKGPFSFAKENGPFDYAARRRHIPPRCARKILCSCYRRNLIFPQD